MIALGTTQASVWGYSTAIYPTAITFQSGTSAIVGSFTKLTMTPNGDAYSIMTTGNVTINGVSRQNVIMKVTPGSTNTATTNWSQATTSYIFSDATYPVDPVTGFGRQPWTQSQNNADVNFNTGVLASNGLIYWPPHGGGKFIIFNPVDETWKTAVTYPTVLSTFGEGAVTSLVLGTDNKIYVFPGTSGGRVYRITTSPNAMSDTAEFGFLTSLVPVLGPTTATLPQSWKDSAGNVYSDTTASLNSLIPAHTRPGTQPAAKLSYIIDAIVHPSGRIYLLPLNGRGRIFYIDIANWGTDRELVSATGLITTQALGAQKGLNLYYSFLEKPRDENHDISTLKIYLVSMLTSSSNASINDIKNSELLYIDPVTNNMGVINMNYRASIVSSNNYPMAKRISLANGATQSWNKGPSAGTITNTGGYMITGPDVSASKTDGVIKIAKDKQGIIYGQSEQQFTSFQPGQSFTGGGVNAVYPNHSKFISIPTSNVTSSFLSEIVSIKEYGPGITYFNYDPDLDKRMYEPPALANISTLGTTLFNSMFNKPK
jgi:hypothetical protein